MANKKSAIKEIRKTATNTARNLGVKTRLKTLTKQARAALAGDDQDAARKAVTSMLSAYDKAVKSNIVHKNKARRYKASFAAALAAKS
jgi:small subunit ribosomal protein S20